MNLYMTKPMLRLNQDFYPKVEIKNSQSTSTDLPKHMINSDYAHLKIKNPRQLKLEL
jgi:hypothetical protein